jgi:hypothetical protein
MMAQTLEQLEAWRTHYRGALARTKGTVREKVRRELQRVERRMRVVKVRALHGVDVRTLDPGSRKAWARRMRRRTRV